MATLDVYFADAAGFYTGELHATGDKLDTFAAVAANAAAHGQTALDISAGAKRPADRPAAAPAPDPLKAAYAAALTDSARLDVVAQKAGLK